jgi:hypothetical protein
MRKIAKKICLLSVSHFHVSSLLERMGTEEAPRREQDREQAEERLPGSKYHYQ